ncbi:DUF1580 domain-containing protein [Bremerella sp. TYQ1]|nr:DUF1580 domain-containing protein [Bremerella volcania]
MTDLLQNGDLLPVASVAEQITGQRPSRPTVWRWLRNGVSGGVRLQAVPIYGKWHTTNAAFRDFLNRRAESMRQSIESRASSPCDDLQADRR